MPHGLKSLTVVFVSFRLSFESRTLIPSIPHSSVLLTSHQSSSSQPNSYVPTYFYVPIPDFPFLIFTISAFVAIKQVDTADPLSNAMRKRDYVKCYATYFKIIIKIFVHM